MSNLQQILVTGASEEHTRPLLDMLAKMQNVKVSSVCMDAIHLPLQTGVHGDPDIWIHCIGENAERDLHTLMDRPRALRPVIILIAPGQVIPPSETRMAMHAGVYDFIPSPVIEEEFIPRLRGMIAGAHTEDSVHSGMTAFISPKGGAGAGSIAGATAHAMASTLHISTLLLDLDTQFGSQYVNLDLHPTLGLKEALEAIDDPGRLTVTGYVAHHPSGLHLLGALPPQVLIPGDIDPERLQRLLHLLQQQYDQIIIDLPCMIDPVFNVIVENVRHLVLVVQQDFQNIRNGQKLLNILHNELLIPDSRISLIINRYEDNGSIKVVDIERALQMKAVAVIPSDFRAVNGAANLGKAILDHAPESPVAKGIVELASWLANRRRPVKNHKSWLANIRQYFS
ncbi:MAG: hypothetical protein RIQ52_1163 [Pseudomonadota bacterium]